MLENELNNSIVFMNPDKETKFELSFPDPKK